MLIVYSLFYQIAIPSPARFVNFLKIFFPLLTFPPARATIFYTVISARCLLYVAQNRVGIANPAPAPPVSRGGSLGFAALFL